MDEEYEREREAYYAEQELIEQHLREQQAEYDFFVSCD